MPHLRGKISRDVHHTAVAHQQRRFLALLRHFHKEVFKLHLRAQGSFLGLVEEFLIVSEIINTGMAKHGGHFRDGKNLETEFGEMLNNLGKCGGLAGTRPSGEDDFSDFIVHRNS